MADVEHTGHYCHEHSVTINVFRDDDADVTEDDQETVTELLRDLMRWLYRTLETEHDYLLSDECVDDSITANEYEFTEAGELI